MATETQPAESPLLRILSADEAQRTVLKRRALSDMELPAGVRQRMVQVFGRELGPAEAVREILQDVRAHGDRALRTWTLRLDGVEPAEIAVPPAEWRAAWERLEPAVQRAMQEAAERVEAFHRRQPLHTWLDARPEGTLGQLVRPIDSVGLYVPGGRASYPSSLLMAAIPARVAGVRTIVVACPPSRETGLPPAGVLAAAHLAGVDRVYRLGGAQAIAALTYGTESVTAVDKICGPGNLFVTLAKSQVMGLVGVDGLPGPTETVIIADDTASPRLVAADMLAQAEHDPLATALLLTPSRRLAEAVAAELERQVASLAQGPVETGGVGASSSAAVGESMGAVAAEALRGQGGAVITSSLDEAIALANTYAPEHLCLSVSDPWSWIGLVRNAGGVFVGELSCETLGDYVAGPSHIMPTGGTARFSSPLSVLDFVKITSLVAVGNAEARALAPAAACLARYEGLEAHARAAEARGAVDG
ncbi:MAG: histidinol dehydrogenase [Anaerolineae bacterium]